LGKVVRDQQESNLKRQEGAAVPALLLIGALVATIALIAVLDRRSTQHVVDARFWFDNVTFEVPGLGGAITDEEQGSIRSMALTELRTAYRGLRVRFSENSGGLYRVRVIQQYPPHPGPPGPVGQSRPLGPFGGEGSVSFQALAALVIHYAPPDAGRTALIEGIARGVGRTAVHEFAHQILFGDHVPPSVDPQSYEYETADRAGQYFGAMHWDTAWPFLVKKLGP
jgi:hypothetical protein